jgi:(p)ppGpp synthase/HD superfamily hydrolase
MAARLEKPLTTRFTDAIAFAADIHRTQSRKGTQIPYLSHILGVASLALDHGADEDEAVAAALHDAIEDAEALGAATVRSWIRFKFGERVLEIVEGCTDADVQPKPAWRERKERYVSNIAHDDASIVLVSAADKLHNARAVLSDFRNVGSSVFGRFDQDAGIDGTLGYYRGLVSAFQGRAQQLQDQRLHRLISELGRTVSELEHEAGVEGRWPLPPR